MKILELLRESYNSTIEKFWINSQDGQFFHVNEEHYSEPPPGLGSIDELITQGWVRGGMSEYDNILYLEAATIFYIRKVLRYLVDRYSPVEVVLDYYEQGSLHSACLDEEGISYFLRSGRIPRQRIGS